MFEEIITNNHSWCCTTNRGYLRNVFTYFFNVEAIPWELIFCPCKALEYLKNLPVWTQPHTLTETFLCHSLLELRQTFDVSDRQSPMVQPKRTMALDHMTFIIPFCYFWHVTSSPSSKLPLYTILNLFSSLLSDLENLVFVEFPRIIYHIFWCPEKKF